MAELALLCVLLVALVQHGVEADREVIQPGGDYHLNCSLPVPDDEDRFITQFYTDKWKVVIFGGLVEMNIFQAISNNTKVREAITNSTDRYVVDEVGGHYRLTINNLTYSDSYYYGCQVYDVYTTNVTHYQNSTELLVPGPLKDVFWTFSGKEIPDGELVLDRPTSKLACVMELTNVEPMFNVTIGHFGDPSTIDITKDFNIISSINLTREPEGVYLSATSSATRKEQNDKRSLRNVTCHASLYGVTLEKSVSVKVISKPETGPCTPSNMSAVVGSQNVTLTCLIEAHPAVADLVWITPDGAPVDPSSKHTNFTVSNQAVFEGLYTTLTLTEVTHGDMFGRYQIIAFNSEGQGTLHMDLVDKDVPTSTPTVTASPTTSPGGAGIVGPSVGSIMMMAVTGLVFWMNAV